MWVPYSLHPDLGSQAGRSEGPEVSEIQDSSTVDIRPHFFDPVMKEYILCDSGSQISAFPPDPGDSQLPNIFLKAANGTRIACFGYKNIFVPYLRKCHREVKARLVL